MSKEEIKKRVDSYLTSLANKIKLAAKKQRFEAGDRYRKNYLDAYHFYDSFGLVPKNVRKYYPDYRAFDKQQIKPKTGIEKTSHTA